MNDVLLIESLDIDGYGLAHRNGRAVRVEGGLPGEHVRVQTVRSKESHEKARILDILKASSNRVEPPCPYFGVCGGCAMQHLHPEAQVAAKQRILEEALLEIGGVQAGQILAPLHGPYWGYRYRARFSVRLVNKKGGVLVGFREKNGRYVADMTACRVLPPDVSSLLSPLRQMLGRLSRPDRIPQIELAKGDTQLALTLRHLEPMTPEDLQILRVFGQDHGVSWYLQAKGPETIQALEYVDEQGLAYTLPEFDLRMAFKPSDFTQVNVAINRSMVSSALKLLDVRPGHRVVDMFCGIGNFSLPLARVASHVLGIEGSATLSLRASQAASEHGLQDKATFATLNLFEVDQNWLRQLGRFDRMLIDPPRDGAQALARALSQLEPQERPERMVYVSCNPATLARDAGILVREGAWRLERAGVINMFPHTAHIESIALFTSRS